MLAHRKTSNYKNRLGERLQKACTGHLAARLLLIKYGAKRLQIKKREKFLFQWGNLYSFSLFLQTYVLTHLFIKRILIFNKFKKI